MRGRAPSPFPEAARTTARAPAEPAPDLPSPAATAETEAAAAGPDEEGGGDARAAAAAAIPPLASMAPAIFAPAVGDYTEPPPPGEPDAGRRLQSVLAELDAHAAAVRANIQAMVLREAARLQAECARGEAALRMSVDPAPSSPSSPSSPLSSSSPPPSPPFAAGGRTPPPPDAERALLLNLEAEAPDPGIAAVLPPAPSPHEVPERVPDPRAAPRARALAQLLNLARRGMIEVDGYAAHAQGVKNATVQAYAVPPDPDRRRD